MRGVFFIFISLLFTGFVQASHSMGADLTYECLGGNQYRVVLSFYRDCSGIEAPAAPYVEVNSSCGDYTVIYLTQVPGTGQEVTPTCDAVNTTCSDDSSPYTGAQEWVYEGIINLDDDCDEWIFSYSSCCRNSAISTIQDPSNMEVYVESFLDISAVDCNSSPVFSNEPVPFICIGEEFCFNHGAIDPDGDSLAYELINPLVASGESVTYLPGYSNFNPISSDQPMTFDELTGDFCVTPNMFQVTVMGVLVKEYRDGQLIGSVMRDMQLRTMNCTNSNPYLTGINGSGEFSTSTCLGSEICFDIPTVDPDVLQQLSLTWNEAIPNALFTVGAGLNPVGRFCWDTSIGDVDQGNYCFTATVRDDNCPYLGYQTYSFCINVTSLEMTLGNNQTISCIDSVYLSPEIFPDTLNFENSWNNGSTLDGIWVQAGEHSVEVTTESGCVVRDTVIVSSFDAPIADMFISGSCSNQNSSFTNLSTTQDDSQLEL